jgi:two-component system sensor histidine kinase CpxA
MRSLFFKIFIIFWIAQSLIFVISTAMIISRKFPHPASLMDPAFGGLRREAAEAMRAYEAKGCAGFDGYARQGRTLLALADESGRTVCGQAMETVNAPLASPDEIYGRQVGNSSIWVFLVTGANGNHYRFMVSVHKEQHTWYGDLLHFAFPQLPVAITVGGVTTFVLVMIFTRPVLGLRKAARELARGRLDTRVKEKRPGMPQKGDEFDALVHDFNHMAERLEGLVNAQRLLLRDVSHELRSPLARLSVALELSRDDADATMSTHLDRIERETERLNQLIGQLLTLSQLETAEALERREKVNLKQLLEDMAPDAAYEAQKHESTVELSANCCECVVYGRRELLYRAVENVVRNAIRYTRPGSRVEIRLWEQRAGNQAVIEVSDRGPGIPESELDAIFKPFYRLDAARSAHTGGAGVGLAIADRAVKLHNGQIRAVNREGGGTTIRISLPCAAEKDGSELSQRA